MKILAACSFAILFVTAACADQSVPEASADTGLDFEAVTSVLVERMDLQPGERVLLVARPGRFDGMLNPLSEAIASREAEYLGAISVTGVPFEGAHATEFVTGLAGLDVDGLQARFTDVDLGIMLPGASVPDPPYLAMQNVLHDGRGRTIHFHWAGAYGLDGVLFEPDAHVDSFYVSSLATTDYTALATNQEAFESAMRGATVRVTTPAGTDISFQIGDRPVTKQDGDASRMRSQVALNLIDREVELPAGAIRVAPIEETVEGTIVFPDGGVWGGEVATGVTLTFEAGRAVSIAATQGLEGVERELDEAGAAGRAFREFALGFNPTLAIPSEEPWIPYYGYGAGVVRLSLGDNTELGGAVGGGYVRWNFFTDATVTVDGDVWVRGGVLTRR